jgi:hypothetical protein
MRWHLPDEVAPENKVSLVPVVAGLFGAKHELNLN